jgi:hypothetical protein
MSIDHGLEENWNDPAGHVEKRSERGHTRGGGDKASPCPRREDGVERHTSASVTAVERAQARPFSSASRARRVARRRWTVDDGSVDSKAPRAESRGYKKDRVYGTGCSQAVSVPSTTPAQPRLTVGDLTGSRTFEVVWP